MIEAPLWTQLATALGGRAEVEIRPMEDGVALIWRPARPAAGGASRPEEKKAEEKRAEMKKPEAAKAVPADFIAELTRETRTSVTTILHALEMATEAAAPGERIPWTDTVGEAARALLRRVDNLAELGLAGRKRPSRSVTFDPMALLRDVMEGVVAKASERGVALEAAVYGELPERVHGDATGFRRVMRLLLNHAVEQAAAEADWALHFSPGDEMHRVRLEVGYRGKIDAALAAWLTAPAGDPQVDLGEAGVNLGLVRRLVEGEMAGRFSIPVQTGDATRFACELEWLPGEVAAPEPERGVKLNGCSVLAVTPDKSLRKVLQMRYAALGLRAMTVDTAEEARRLLAEAVPGAFDLVLVQYSHRDGLAFARWLAADAQWKHLPRLTVSMAGEPGQAATAEEAGYQGYLTPPLPLELMRDMFTSLLGRAAAGASGELITRFSLAEAASARVAHGQHTGGQK